MKGSIASVYSECLLSFIKMLSGIKGVGFLYSKGENSEKSYLVYIKAIIRGLVLSLILLLLTAIVFYFTALSDQFINLAAWVITIVTICYSGIYTSYRMGRKGLIHGMLIGLLFIITLILIALIASKGELRMITYVIMLITGIIVGGLSGVIGTLINKG